MNIRDAFEIGESFFTMNAKLQQKKNRVRKELAQKGILGRDGFNNFDKYKYFSEAQYKLLFTELLSKNDLELKVDEVENMPYSGTEKMPFGRVITLEFTLIDTETGFFETSKVSGEGADKGDKGGYKAYTGALKYYLANTFMVATGDDPEKDEEKPKETPKKLATAKQIEALKAAYPGDSIKKLLEWAKVEKVEDLPMEVASGVLKRVEEKKNARTNTEG